MKNYRAFLYCGAYFSAPMTCCVLFIFTFICMISPNAMAAKNIDLLLVAYDQGESNAFKQLEKKLEKQGIDYRIVSMGRASEVFRNHPLNLSISAQNKELLRDNRETALPDIALIGLSEQVNPRIVYSGMASVAQAQIINHMKTRGSYTLAFYDNFDSVVNKEYVQPFLNRVRFLDEFHIPSAVTRQSFNGLAFSPSPLYTVSGQPALEAWDEIYRQTDHHRIRLELSLDPQAPVVVFAGGYDDTYEDYFRVFIEATRKLPAVTFLVTYHPKTNGEIERRWINERGARNVRLVENSQYSTAALTQLSVAVMVHKSSIGAMALYKGKSVIYIAEPEMDNFLIRKKLAFLASTPDEVVRTFQSAIATHDPFPSLESLDMPDKPSEFIAAKLKAILNDSGRLEPGRLPPTR